MREEVRTKCMPMTFSGRFEEAAILVIEIELVFVARMAPLGVTWNKRQNQ